MKVYLAGPITGCSYDGCTSWREHVKTTLSKDGIECFSPLRSKIYLREEMEIEPSYDEYPLSTNRGITTRDRWDATRCDVLLVNVIGATKVSVGTVLEMAWADLSRTPIVFVTDNDVHTHGMIDEIIGFKLHNLEDALDVVRALLLG